MKKLYPSLLRHWYAGRVLPILMVKSDEWRAFGKDQNGVDLMELDESYGSRGWLRKMSYEMADIMLDKSLDKPDTRKPYVCSLDTEELKAEAEEEGLAES